MRTAPFVLALFALGCDVDYGTVCLDDGDSDGLCGDADICPADAENDADGDGLCAGKDVCPLGDDALDADDDAIADACDVCPSDALNDEDADAVCDSEDRCPNDAAATCTRAVTVGLGVDYYFEESRWELVLKDGTIVDEGGFDGPGVGWVRTYDIPVEADKLCVRTYDTYGDGGVRGKVWDDVFGEERVTFEASDWTTEGEWCFRFDGGRPTGLERPWEANIFTDGFSECWVELELNVLTWGNEIGWTLADPRRRIMASQAPGVYANSTVYKNYVLLGEGPWIYVMQDSFGDGWHGGSITIRSTPGGEPIGYGALPSGREGYVPFTLDCPPEGTGFPPP
ncbi:MAG: hypothetical protein RLZZ383_2212 [Pseudomonadota bacterium]|jgi:hypothetical protein